VVRRGNPARLVVALAIAAVLAVFLLYTSIAGGGTPTIQPSELKNRNDQVVLAGKVIGPLRGDAHGAGLRFVLRDVQGTARLPVLYRGSVPDLFKVGRDISLTGRLQNGVFVGKPGTLVTKCPSKYTAKKD
jgi:cytochrome c-type biogenesis protein CcmE